MLSFYSFYRKCGVLGAEQFQVEVQADKAKIGDQNKAFFFAGKQALPVEENVLFAGENSMPVVWVSSGGNGDSQLTVEYLMHALVKF